MKSVFSIFLIFLSCYSVVFAQNSGDQIFDNSVLHEIRFTFNESNYWSILSNNYDNNADPFQEKPYLMCDVVIDGVQVDSIGLRFKGFTSYFTYGNKKPFKLDFNEFVSGQKFDGLRKLNLNNGTGDPSMQRDVIAYNVLRSVGVHAPRTSYTKVYLNDEYFGVYQIIEQVDRAFIGNNFSSDNGNLFKNLSWSKLEYLGNDPSEYKQIFDLKTNETVDDWTGLIDFLYFLNNSTDEEFQENIDEFFNVDLFLKTLAVDVATNNWDSYLEHGRNWYMYEDVNTGIIHWIPWDYNLSLAGDLGGGGIDECEIFVDFSTFTNGTTQVEFNDASFAFGEYSLTWDFGDGNSSTESEPIHVYDEPGIYTVCLEIYVDDNCRDSLCKEVDTNYDFADCTSVTSGEFTGEVGAAFAEVVGFSPWCCDSWSEDCQDFYDWISGDDDFGFSFDFSFDQRENEGVLIRRLLSIPSIYDKYLSHACDLVENHFVDTKINDLINQNEELILDAMLEETDHLFFEDEIIADFSEEGLQMYISDRTAACSAELDTIGNCMQAAIFINPMDLVINELMASNDSLGIVSDEAGEFDDWIELYNNSGQMIDLSDAYLSDDADNLLKWNFPFGTTINAGEYLTIWADKDEDQGLYHTNFKLNKLGDQVFLSNSNGSIIDQIVFDAQNTNIALARIPNGIGEFINQIPSFGYNNENASAVNELPNESITIFPNPVIDILNVEITGKFNNTFRFDIYNSLGELVKSISCNETGTSNIDVSNFKEGIYFINPHKDNSQFSYSSFIKL